MNKTFNINLGGCPFAIDEDAYLYIQNYLNAIRKHFSASEGCEEILYDIEVRMSELFQEHLKGKAIISMKEVDEIIMIMGKPEDFGAEPMDENPATFTKNGSSQQNRSKNRIGTGKRLFRDPDDKKIGGVCSGIAAYFGVDDPLWVRLIFVVLFFIGISPLLYFVLWVLVPEANTSSDKLAMRGEPATINNIAKIVEEELNELGSKINEWGKEISGEKKNINANSKYRMSTARNFLAKGVNILGDVATGIIPVMANIIKPIFVTLAIIALATLGISWAGSFVGLTMASPILLAVGPDSTMLGYLGIGSLFFTLGLPILGAMLLISKLAFSYKLNKNIKTGLWSVWFLSLFISMFTVMTTIKAYNSYYTMSSTQDYNISDPNISIEMPEEGQDQSFNLFGDNRIFNNGEQWSIRDVKIQIEKSKDALVHIKKTISSRGEYQKNAQANALLAKNDLTVKGNTISISKYFTIPKDANYRNQRIVYTIYVPEGKNISLNDNVKSSIYSSGLFGMEQIYSNIDGIKWTVKGNGVYSESYNDIYHHTKEIQTGTFNKIIIENNFDVIIKKGSKASVTCNGNKAMVEGINFKNLDGTLTLNAEGNEFENVSITIETPSLELIHMNGVKSAVIDGFNQDNLKLFAADSPEGYSESDIKFSGNIKNFDISMEGNQRLSLIGTGETLSAVLNDGATISAEKFIVNNASVTGDHTHESTFYVQKQLSCTDPNMVGFKVYGNPKIIKL
jgi:phage shock protein PspC (stress-responsive transcriptional regulator)